MTISILTSCRRGYKIEDDKVYYESWNEGIGQTKRIIEQADAKTFKELSFDCDCDFEWGLFRMWPPLSRNVASYYGPK